MAPATESNASKLPEACVVPAYSWSGDWMEAVGCAGAIEYWHSNLVSPGPRSGSSAGLKTELHPCDQRKKKPAPNNDFSMRVANGEKATTSYAIDRSGKP